MKRSGLLVALFVTACCWNTRLLADGLTLTRDGQPAAVILLGDRPTKAAQFAAFELASHVKAISGASLPIVRGSASVPAGHARIHVGDGARAQALGLTQQSFRYQEYAVRSGPDEIILVGKDANDFVEVTYDVENLADWTHNMNWPGFWEERGTLHAVYDFLRDGCGVRWFNPTDTGTLIPHQPTLTVKAMDRHRAPTFRFRDALGGANSDFYDAWVSLWGSQGPKADGFKAWEAAAYADLHRHNPSAGALLWAKRNTLTLFLLRMRNGGQIARCNHSLYGYYSRFWKKDPGPEGERLFVAKRPELFAQGYEGDRPPQMCYTSRALVEQVARDARDYYDGKTDLAVFWRPEPPNPFPVEPMDNASFCRCPECQKWISRGKDYGAVEHFSQGIHSDYFFQFVNAVQQELAKTHPDKGVITLAYMTHAWPPNSVKLDPRVAVQFCFALNRSPGVRAQYENELRLVRLWGEEARASGRSLYLWLYYTFPKETADNGNYYCFPGFFAHTISEQMGLFKRLGYRGMFHCGYGQEVESYVTFRLMDNADLNVDALLDEYFSGLYGAAAAPLKKLYAGIEAVYCDADAYGKNKGVSGAALAWGCLGTAERMAEFGRLMDEAKQAATTPREKRNVALFDLAVWKYMTTGRAQYAARTGAPIPAIRAPAVADAGGNPALVAWDKAAPLGDAWFQRGADQPASRKLSGRIAHDATHLYVELVDPCQTKKLVVSSGVAAYDDWELFLAGQRALPYRHFLVGPTGMVVALLDGEVNWRMNVLFLEHGVRVASDTAAPDRWVTRLAIPLREAVPGGAKPGGKIYLNVVRVTSPAVSGQPHLDIATWVSHTTVHEVDRLAEITLEK